MEVRGVQPLVPIGQDFLFFLPYMMDRSIIIPYKAGIELLGAC